MHWLLIAGTNDLYSRGPGGGRRNQWPVVAVVPDCCCQGYNIKHLVSVSFTSCYLKLKNYYKKLSRKISCPPPTYQHFGKDISYLAEIGPEGPQNTITGS